MLLPKQLNRRPDHAYIHHAPLLPEFPLLRSDVFIVINYEYLLACLIHLSLYEFELLFFYRQGHLKGCSLPEFPIQGDMTAKHVQKIFCDRQPEACPLVTFGRCIAHLAERGKKSFPYPPFLFRFRCPLPGYSIYRPIQRQRV